MATGSINISSNISRSEMILQSYPPKACKNLTAKVEDGSISLTWIDPEDYVSTDNKNVTWKYTRIVRKTGSYPINETDGTVVVESSTRDQYRYTPFKDENLTNHTTYYYRAFACSTDGVFNRERVEVSETPVPWKVMTVVIDLNNSNPESCCSYLNDATSMVSGINGTSVWQNFFGYKPCLFKDGKVVGYLNPNDYTKFEDGSDADITSGNAGSVMIEYPRCGLNISKVNKKITISMTNNPNDSNFKYYAHQRGNISKDAFYLGAYVGTLVGGKLKSISDSLPTTNYCMGNFYKYAVANGTGYGIMCFYQLLYIQAMYILQFKNLSSGSVLGFGGSSDNAKTGTGNSYGLNHKSTMYGNVVKMFGIEGPWGFRREFLNNAYFTNSNLRTTTDDTITNMTKYEIDGGQFGYTYGTSEGYVSDCI